MQQAVTTIQQRIEQLWVDGLGAPLTPIAWPGVFFDPPESPWLQVDFVWAGGFIETKTPGKNHVVGVLELSIAGPKDGGDGALYTLADTARAMFNRVRLGGISFNAPSGPDTQFEEEWRRLVVSCPFTVDDPA